MATPNVGILTNAGKNLIDQVNAGQTKITFSKIVFSSMNNNQLTDDQIKALTTVTPQEIVVNNPEVTLDNNTGETRIRATGNNEALDDGVYVKTYAVYAKDDSGNEILYGITVSPNPNYLPEYDGVTPQAVTYSYKVNISNTTKITFTNSNDVYVSDTDLAEALQPYAKTVDVNQQLDKKVIDNKDGTEQLNGVQVQPFNKLTDVEDHRNYLTGTANDLIIPANASNFNYYSLFYPLVPGEKYTFSSEVTLTGTANNVISVRVYQSDGNSNTTTVNDAFIADGTRHSWTFVCPPNGYYLFIYAGVTGKTANIGATFHHSQLELGLPTPWHQSVLDKADDSKVAHLSGANNFDTVPMVNNNPLLLASSLPSDLARTGQDQEFTGKNTFDTAPIDKTTGNPYITKDGVPSDVARTGQANTFTDAQTFSIAPVINDASKDKGDNQAATMADLKSVENSAWRSVNLSDDAKGMGFDNAFYLKNETTKQFTLIFTGTPSGVNSVFSTPKTLFTDSEISAYTKLSSLSTVFGTRWNDTQASNNELNLTTSISNNSIMFTTSFHGGIQDSNPSDFSDLDWVGYGKFAGTYK